MEEKIIIPKGILISGTPKHKEIREINEKCLKYIMQQIKTDKTYLLILVEKIDDNFCISSTQSIIPPTISDWKKINNCMLGFLEDLIKHLNYNIKEVEKEEKE